MNLIKIDFKDNETRNKLLADEKTKKAYELLLSFDRDGSKSDFEPHVESTLVEDVTTFPDAKLEKYITKYEARLKDYLDGFTGQDADDYIQLNRKFIRNLKSLR